MVKYIQGDLFALAPKDATLSHACNCYGSWGAGIAAAFRLRYPKAYTLYRDHCSQHEPSALVGTTFIIPRSSSNPEIACLFTSQGSGRNVATPDSIVKATAAALQDYQRQSNKPLHMPKINAGLFRVPWKDTEKVLIQSGLDITVYEL